MTITAELNLNVVGNREQLNDNFTAGYNSLVDVYKELGELEAEFTAINEDGRETLKQLEQRLLDVEEQLKNVTDLTAGKEALKVKQDIVAEIELQQTITAGRTKQIKQDITAKVVEFYAVMDPLKTVWSTLRQEIVATASVMTVINDEDFIRKAESRLTQLMAGVKHVLLDTGVLVDNDSTLFTDDKRVYLNSSIHIPTGEYDVLDALEHGKRALDR